MLDVHSHLSVRPAKPVPLCREHSDYLAASSYHICYLLLTLLRKWTHLGLDRFSKARQRLRVYGVCLR